MRPVHFLAECLTCGKVWQARNAAAVAARHSKAHRHESVAEVLLSGRWINGAAQELCTAPSLAGRDKPPEPGASFPLLRRLSASALNADSTRRRAAYCG